MWRFYLVRAEYQTARELAERVLREANTTEDRIELAFRLVTGRQPKAEETFVLRRVLDQQTEAFRKDREAATKLLGVGEARRDDRIDAAELAAWATVASAILNLDETVSRG